MDLTITRVHYDLHTERLIVTEIEPGEFYASPIDAVIKRPPPWRWQFVNRSATGWYNWYWNRGRCDKSNMARWARQKSWRKVF